MTDQQADTDHNDSPNEDSVLEQQYDAQHRDEEEAPCPAARPRLCSHAHRYHRHVHQGQKISRQKGCYEQREHGDLQSPVLQQVKDFAACGMHVCPVNGCTVML